MSKPSSNHMAATKRILSYVKGTLGYGPVYRSEKECHLLGYYARACAREQGREIEEEKIFSPSCITIFMSIKAF